MADPLHVIGVYADVEWAARGLGALLAAGFAAGDLSVMARRSDAVRDLARRLLGVPAEVVEGELAFPIVAAGPLAAVLQGSPGLASHGLAASLTRAGFQRHDGHIFATLVDRGGVLVGITTEPRAADALALLHSYGAGNAAIGAWTGRV